MKFSVKRKSTVNSPKSLKFKKSPLRQSVANEDLDLSGNSNKNLVYISPSRLKEPKLYEMPDKASFGVPQEVKKKLKIKIKKFTAKEKLNLQQARDALKTHFTNEVYIRSSGESFGAQKNQNLVGLSIESAKFPMKPS